MRAFRPLSHFRKVVGELAAAAIVAQFRKVRNQVALLRERRDISSEIPNVGLVKLCKQLFYLVVGGIPHVAAYHFRSLRAPLMRSWTGL